MKTQKLKFRIGDIVEIKGMASAALGIKGKGEITKVLSIEADNIRYRVKFGCSGDPFLIEERYLKLIKRPYFGGLFVRIRNRIRLPYINFHLRIPFVDIRTHLFYLNHFNRTFEMVLWHIKIWKWRFEFSLYTKPKRIR